MSVLIDQRKEMRRGQIRKKINIRVKLCYTFPPPLGDNSEAFYLFIMCTVTIQNADDMKIKMIWSLPSRNRIRGEDL